ncbi:hypothetical protein KBA73_05630 [Patescibacteria group bacterium]|nr:hypothetical protein [Patescibacteria group bacterium]
MTDRHHEQRVEMDLLADRLSFYLHNGGTLSDEKREALLAALKASDLSKHVAKVPRPIAPQPARQSERPKTTLDDRVYQELKAFMASDLGRPNYATIPTTEHAAAALAALSLIKQYMNRISIGQLSRAMDFVADFRTGTQFEGFRYLQNPNPFIQDFRKMLGKELLVRQPKEEEMRAYFRLFQFVLERTYEEQMSRMDQELNAGRSDNTTRYLPLYLPLLKQRLQKAF